MPTIAEKKFGEFLLTAHESRDGSEFDVDAYVANGRLIGRAEFAPVYDYEANVEQDEWYPLVALKGWDVAVNSDYRRQGLATAMYDFAERTWNVPIRSGDFQTPEGKRFLTSRKRSR